ncbi:MAG: fasciclin domain-containing protein [Bacteroidaceae bacterium]|nr:fasciclin domain-containing protein [Bacteroidaceae bacterium]
MKKKSFLLVSCLLLMVCGSVFTSCKEDIDDSAYAIKDDPTIADILDSRADLSYIKAIFERVRLGNASNASSIYAALSARGNYTVFAPGNDAVAAYCQSTIGTTDITQLSYELAQLLAYSCVIDNEDASAYESAEFPTDGSTFLKSNLYDRLLTCEEQEAGPYIINGTSELVPGDFDHEATNGYLHVIATVIAPSSKSVAELIADADNLHIMANLITVTGMASRISEDRDIDYENNADRPEERYWSSVAYSSGNYNWPIPTKRYLGCTGFVETDDVFQSEWGIEAPQLDADGNVTNWAAIQAQLLAKAQAAYPECTDADPTSYNNALNRFVAYHFIKGRIAFNRFVHHFNEHNYQYGSDPLNPQTQNYTVDCWDYFTTIPLSVKMVDNKAEEERALIKVLQVPDGDHEIYLNRISKYNNGLRDDYKEVSTRAYQPGINIKVNALNGVNDNNAANGFYYPIDGILVYDQATREALTSERIRVDLTTILPELISNNYRGQKYEAFEHGYFENITNETENTEMYYLNCGWISTGWHDYEGDEMLFSGVFDFVLRLPPVPVTDQYEIRMGCANNELRGMAQLYFGDSPDRCVPVGLPFDLRQKANYDSNLRQSANPDIPFIKDEHLDWDEDRILENDKDMRVHGYMKAPNYFWDIPRTSQARHQGGDGSPCLRKIVTTQVLEAGKSYYIRFKSSLKKTNSQFFVDYFEFVPKAVYDGVQAEDVW